VTLGNQKALSAIVGAPLPVVVNVRDEQTGAVLTEAKLEWLETESDPPEPTAIGHAIPATGPGRFEFRAPTGSFAIRASNPVNRGYIASARLLRVASDMDPVEIRLARDFTVILTLRDGDKSVTWERSKTILSSLGPSDTGAAASLGKFQWLLGRLSFHLAKPGRYRLEPIQIKGFHATPACEIEFEPTGNRTYLIQLPLIRE